MITGLIRTSSLSYSEINEINSQVVESSPTFDNMYEYSDESEYGAIAGAPSDDPNSKFVIFEASGDTAHNLFAQYALTNELIRIRASFLTRFHMEHVQGNYGLEIEFFTKGDPISFRLDVSSFLGNPYSYTVYSPQTVIVQVPMGYLIGLKSITLFEENFVYDRYVENGIVTDKENRTNANIFVSNIELGFVKTTDALDNLYYLDIQAPQGRFLTSTTTSIDLVGRLIYSGQNIMNESNCTCKWFERDVSVMVGDEEYDKDAGVGWKPIETYIFNTLTVSLTDILYKKEYKLVVLYNNSTLMSATVNVQNLTVGYDFELIQDTRGEDLVLYISDTDLVGDWYVLYPDGNYQLVQEKVNEIIVNNFLNYSSVIFYCGVYNEAETSYIAALAHTITASDSEDDITISYVGEDTFRYDANGDISIEDSERERTLQVTLAWRDGVATSYTVDWIGPDGQELSSSMYNPTESMMEQVWIDNSNILHYHIKQKYKVNYTNNTFTVRITTIDGNSYSFLKEILFLKDGDQGTNGTTYVVAIRPCDTNGTKLAGFNPLVYYNGAWSGNRPLRCYVYKDGELINGNSHYTLQYTWTPHNVNLTPEAAGMEDRQIASGLDTIINTPIAPYVTVEVTINDQINGRETSIYAYYPLDVAVNYSANEIETIDISSIPSYIKYTSGGTNPQFYSNNIEFVYNGTSYSQYITSLNTDILQLENNEGLIYLQPASSFIFENTQIPMLRCAATDNATSYVLHPIAVYLDTYGNENINGWDGQQLVIDEENGEYIFAPQIGAGTKDSQNRFTGVVMGQNSSPNIDRNNIIGLYGYNSGQNTFGLQANGKAYFGTGNGRIVIDGSTGEATISGGGGGNSASGMTITLNNVSGSADTQAIRIGNGNFYVTYGGQLNATGAVINGTITAAANSRIGGWIIGEHDFHSESGGQAYVALNSQYLNTATEEDDAYYAMWAGRTSGYSASQYTFAVTKTGVLYARDATIKGDITADTLTCNDGTIGGWIIDSNGFRNSSNTVYLRNNGSMKVGDNFSVSTNGSLTARTGNFYGGVTLYPSAGENQGQPTSSSHPDYWMRDYDKFDYTKYTYNTRTGIMSSQTRYLRSISLSDVITNLMTGQSRIEALADQATAIAAEASQAATDAEQASSDAEEAAAAAQDGVNALSWLTNWIDNLSTTNTSSMYMGDRDGIRAKMYITDGDIGIQASAFDDGYWKWGSGSIISCHSGGDIQIVANLGVRVTADEFTYNGQAIQTSGSDKRIKHNISYNKIQNYSNLFFSLRPTEFIFNTESDKETKSLGFIAQDVLKLLGKDKALVRQNMTQPNGEKYYSLDYNSITTLNTYMLQEAYKKIDTLEQEVATLKALIKGENGDI